MASTLILGSDRMALMMAKFLVGAGERVCLMGVRNGAREALTALLQEGVEADVPFQFVDDIRHQQALMKKRLESIQFCKRISECDSNLKAVLATKHDSLADISYLGSVPVATLAGEARHSNEIAVRLYQPIEQTKVAQIIVSPPSDPAAVEAIKSLLGRCGIEEITREQAESADLMLRDKSVTPKPSIDDVIRAILPTRQPIDYSNTVMH